MKLLIFLLVILQFPTINWLGNIDIAKAEAKQSHKLILINFSGSDWCIPCIKLRKKILESDIFTAYAGNHLILLRADFPRLKKNQMGTEQVKLNEALADKYNPDGAFPLTLLINAEGKVLQKWDGFPNESANQFVSQIADIRNAENNTH